MKLLRWLWAKVERLAELCVFFCALPFVIWAGGKGLLFGVLRHSKDQETEASLVIDGAVKCLTVDQAHRVLQAAYARYVSKPVSVIIAEQVITARQAFENNPPKGETFH